jgi:hypothetical protein
VGRRIYSAVRELTAHPFGFRERYVLQGVARFLRVQDFACDLLRDILGNPLGRRPVLDEVQRAWGDGLLAKLAGAIYDERAFDRLPVLADALEEAGCTDADVIGHCRQADGHTRGCWAVDLVLGKE